MTNKLILKKAIEKAEQNDYCSHCVFNCFPLHVVLAVRHKRISVDEANLECVDIILTDHDFWKALCGSFKLCDNDANWRYHMAQCLVYEKDRFKYLKQFI